MTQLILQGVEKQFGPEVKVLHGIDLEIASGELMVFVGPSGCGKTTLMRCIAGLEQVSAGRIVIGHEEAQHLPPAERGVAMVFQSYALYPHMSVAENIGFALKFSKTPKAEAQAAVQQAAKLLQIEALLHRKPKELSGGQRQRVAIGRAIVRHPKVFLFDEPLSNLDAALRVQMRVELAKLHRELGTTMVYVTHDQVEAMTLGTRIAVFNAGRIEQVGSPLELYRHPRSQFVAGFLGSPQMSFMQALAQQSAEGVHVTVAEAGTLSLPGQTLAEGHGHYTLGIRPEHFSIARTGQGLKAQVDQIEHLGDCDIVYARPAGLAEPVAVKLTQDVGSIACGDVIHLKADPANCHLFDRQGRVANRP